MKILKSIDNFFFGDDEWAPYEKAWYYLPLTFGVAVVLFVYVAII